MPTLHCDRCGALVGTVRDTRCGILPSSTRCVACTTPAFRPRALPL